MADTESLLDVLMERGYFPRDDSQPPGEDWFELAGQGGIVRVAVESRSPGSRPRLRNPVLAHGEVAVWWLNRSGALLYGVRFTPEVPLSVITAALDAVEGE
jgi:hypothetical protein